MMTDTPNNVQPLEDRVVIEPTTGEEITKSGLIIAGAQERGYPVKGRVISTGPGVVEKGTLSPVDAQPGDEIYYVKGKEVVVDDARSIISEGAIVARTVAGRLIPYWDKVLVELKTDGGNSAGGVVLISNKDEQFDEGVVIATGPGFVKRGHRQPMDLAAGDKILFNQYNGVELDLGMDDTRRLLLVREFDVYGVLS